ncbi:cilia- and flagella-associated protein 65 isoform X1 [Gadus macrocephalus]|uniref:cilia- and flagella-associated protein 65 isoform X1 n=1 Tax=Gadus macrocephalus TaxID=80720 RepID=UPI0028CBB992|nr:cilia- and flagella-associated protein 65 isoform X1 [Gadus macrocephalus]
MDDVRCHSSQPSGEPQRPREPHPRPPSQRCCFLGVETSPELLWEDWELGKNFTKTLVLKNVHSKLQKLRLRAPVSKYFRSVLTQQILISPGTSYPLPLTFSPHERCEYEDSVAFEGRDGSFVVSLRATLPRHALVAPDSVLLPICALKHSTQTTLVLKNQSKLHTWFQWECPPPFHVSPDQGLLEPSQEGLITVVFQPHEALVHQREAFCRFGDTGEELLGRCTVLLRGQAKYPSLQLRCTEGEEDPEAAPELLFGSVAIGCHRKKPFTICNMSPVTASFAFSCLQGGTPQLGSEFSCDVSSGEVAPGSSLRATVHYSPVVVDTVAVDYLTLVCPGALNKTQLKLTGTCIGPIVTLSCSMLDFGHLDQGQAAMRNVDLVNSSPCEAVYQWDLDGCGHSVFSVQPTGGTLQPNSHITLKVAYRPQSPMIHHRRVACLILHRGPVFLDVIGTCHSELQKPAVLRPKHLTMYRLHRRRGLTLYPPDQLSAMLQNRSLRLDHQGALCLLDEESSECSAESPDILSENSLTEEYYQASSGGLSPLSSSSSSSHISVEPAELVFHCAPSAPSRSSSQSVCITNRTKGMVSLVWTTDPDSPFAVSPVSCDLSPRKSTSFGVSYDPKQLNALHGAQLECFAIYKVLREPGQVEEGLLFPSWCVTVRVIGHSFQLGREHFVPRCTLQPPTVVFPALSLLSYRTVLLQNSGDLPLSFNLHPDQSSPLAGSVSVVPGCGLVLPRHHQILHLRTTPTKDCPRHGFSLNLQLNGAMNTQEITVFSWVEEPSVAMEAEGCLHLQPTAVGSSSQRSHCIRNTSRVPLGYQWRIPGEDSRVICVDPELGEMQPNDSVVQTWMFSPLEETTYNMTPFLSFWPIQTPGGRTSRLGLEVTAMGCQGTIRAESPVVELGEMLVGGSRAVEVPLVNSSLCPLSLGLEVQQTLLDQELTSDPRCTEPLALHLESSRRTVPSCSRLLLTVTVTPHRRARYKWTLSYRPLSATGCELGASVLLCELRAEGVLPTLRVADARCGGSVGGLSKRQLWSLFSLDSLNLHLLSCPSPQELTYRKTTQHSLHRCPSIFRAAILDFNFCSAPVASEPSTVLMLLDNIGPIPAEWALLFPENQRMEVNHWAESGEFSSTELHQMKVQDNRLFSVSPRSGILPPGQQRALQLTYRHDFAGAHRLPVVFKLSHGREILLNFQGVTVERHRPYLHFSRLQHVFSPVAVGVLIPPRQVYDLYNSSTVVVHYEVDAYPLQQLQEQNFHHPVLCCLTPRGEVRPGRTAQLEWLFSPLEAKVYNVDIVIHTRGGDSTVVSFEGRGFDPRALGPSDHVCLPSVPCMQKAALPEQVVFLSEESVSLGNVPVHSRSTRLLSLTNVSHTEAVQYGWELPQQDGQQVVQMHPSKGRLGAGESILCVLTLNTPGWTVLYQLDLICQITMETELAEYRESVRRVEEERERQQQEFTITERDLGAGGGQATQGPRSAPVQVPLPLRRYQTLPPLRSISSSTMAGGLYSSRGPRAERHSQREGPAGGRMPTPTLLHLGVTARSHGLLEYQALFPDNLSQHHVYRSPRVETQGSHWAVSSTAPPTAALPHLVPGQERDILTDTLLSLIRSLIDDQEFQRRLARLPSEGVPYFSQLRAPDPPGYPSPGAPLPPVPRPYSAPPGPSLPRGLRPAGAGVALKERPHTVGAAENHPRPSLDSRHADLQTQRDPDRGHVRRIICRCAEFSDVCEDVLLNTLQNLMMEAFHRELDLTAPPPPPAAMTSVSPGGEMVHEGQGQQ